EGLLDLDGCDVHPGGLDDVLQASGEVEAAVRVEKAQVAGAEEALGRERLRARHAEVALHERRAAHEDLARLARPEHASALGIDNAHLHAGERAAERARAHGLRIVAARARYAGGGLAHAVHPDRAMPGPHQPRCQRVVASLREREATPRKLRMREERRRLMPAGHHRAALGFEERERGARLDDLLQHEPPAARDRGERPQHASAGPMPTHSAMRRAEMASAACAWTTAFACAVVPEVKNTVATSVGATARSTASRKASSAAGARSAQPTVPAASPSRRSTRLSAGSAGA